MNAPKFIKDLIKKDFFNNAVSDSTEYTDSVAPGAGFKYGPAISIYNLSSVGMVMISEVAVPVRIGDIFVSRRNPRKDVWVIDDAQIIKEGSKMLNENAKNFCPSAITIWRHVWSPYLPEIPSILEKMGYELRCIYELYPDRAKAVSIGNINFSQPLPLP